MTRTINNPGDKFNKLTLINFVEVRNQKSYWNFKCDCGNFKVIALTDVKTSNTKSCGCQNHKESFINLVGKSFGKLKVLSLERKESWNQYYKVLCECGNEEIISGKNLKKRKNKSCGCNKPSKIKDLVGKIFGDLTVIKFSHICKNGTHWKVKCKCGKENVVLGQNLLRGLTKSCNCLRSPKGRNIKDLTGKTFGQLTVLKFYSSLNDKSFWNVECTCGREVIRMGIGLTNGSIKSCGCRKRSYTEFGNIYGIVNNSNNIIYVGQTIKENISYRLTEHLRTPVNKKMKEWLNSINYKPEIKLIMKNVPLEKLDYAEKKAIKFFNKKFELNNIYHK